MESEGESILEKLDAVAPIHKFDAFPKVPATYKAKSSGGGFWTAAAILMSLLLILNDVHEFIWGWPDHEFSVDTQVAKTMIINVDMVVNMPCHCKRRVFLRLLTTSLVLSYSILQISLWTCEMLLGNDCISAMVSDVMG
jgi:hypothetical protein